MKSADGFIFLFLATNVCYNFFCLFSKDDICTCNIYIICTCNEYITYVHAMYI
jgi:hypothetical protein